MSDKFTQMKVAILTHVPFYGHLMLDIADMKVGKFAETIYGTAATDGKNIWFDEDYLEELHLDEAVFVASHETEHIIRRHCQRIKAYRRTGLFGQPLDVDLYNRACDYVINAGLVHAKIGRMPRGGLLDPRFDHNMLSEEVYKILLQEKQQKQQQGQPGQPGQGQPGQGQGQGQPQGHGGFDHHIESSAEADNNEAEIKRAVKSAAHAAKAMGKLPGHMERVIEEIMNPKQSWQERLRFAVSNVTGRDGKTWTRAHRRRLVSQRIYLPAYSGYASGHLVVAADTSGSISQREFDVIFGHVDAIVMDCHPERVTLLGCDTEVGGVFELGSGMSLLGQKLDLRGGGGTAFEPVFEWVAEQGITPDCLIYFTDMYGSFPSKEPDYPVIWARIESREEAPWGEVVDIDREGNINE